MADHTLFLNGCHSVGHRDPQSSLFSVHGLLCLPDARALSSRGPLAASCGPIAFDIPLSHFHLYLVSRASESRAKPHSM